MMGAEIETYSEMMARMFGTADADMMADDPVLWVRGNGEEVWSKQAEILESVRDNRYTAVHSAHDMGKSFIASRAIAWWISSHPPGSAFVVSTAPSAAQVAAIMWREVTKIHKKAGLVGQINRAGYPQWYIDGELVGYGRKPADYEQSAFQGIHAEFVLIVIDEACGVSQQLYDAVDSLATNENARVLAIGNPDDPASHFAKVCSTDQGWNTIHLDGLRSPNITYDRVVGPDPENPKWPLLAHLMAAEGIPYSEEEVPDELRPLLINEQWIEERIARWAGVSAGTAEHILTMQGREALHERLRSACEGSSLFTAKVRGVFPTSATEGVIPLGWVQRAVERWHDIRAGRVQRHRPGNFILGIDVARSGDDETVFAHRYGSHVTKLEKMRVGDTTEIVDRAAAFLHEPRSTAVVDVIGIGSGVYDLLRRYRADDLIVGQTVPFNASAQSNRRDKLGQFRFLNDRAAAWWNLRELLDPAFGSQIALPDDEDMIAELVSPKWLHHVGGKIKVEAKEDIKRRIGRSTDSADAVIAAFWITGEPGVSDGYEYGHTMARDRDQIAAYGYEGFENFTFDTLSVNDVDFSDI
jgi:hypothetical protein